MKSRCFVNKTRY